MNNGNIKIRKNQQYNLLSKLSKAKGQEKIELHEKMCGRDF